MVKHSNLIFFRRLTRKLRKVFSKERWFSVKVQEPTSDPGITNGILPVKILSAEPEKESGNLTQAEKVFRLLAQKNKAVGRPFSSRTPEIRMVYVDSFVDAFIYFLRLCDQRLLTYRQIGPHLHCMAIFPDGSGRLSFTDKVKCRNKEVIAVLKVEIATIKPKISEIRFEVKHNESIKK